MLLGRAFCYTQSTAYELEYHHSTINKTIWRGEEETRLENSNSYFWHIWKSPNLNECQASQSFFFFYIYVSYFDCCLVFAIIYLLTIFLYCHQWVVLFNCFICYSSYRGHQFILVKLLTPYLYTFNFHIVFFCTYYLICNEFSSTFPFYR